MFPVADGKFQLRKKHKNYAKNYAEHNSCTFARTRWFPYDIGDVPARKKNAAIAFQDNSTHGREKRLSPLLPYPFEDNNSGNPGDSRKVTNVLNMLSDATLRHNSHTILSTSITTPAYTERNIRASSLPLRMKPRFALVPALGVY
jgi:hypothetical protein